MQGVDIIVKLRYIRPMYIKEQPCLARSTKPYVPRTSSLHNSFASHKVTHSGSEIDT